MPLADLATPMSIRVAATLGLADLTGTAGATAGQLATFTGHQPGRRPRRTGLRRPANNNHHRRPRLPTPIRKRLLDRPRHPPAPAPLIRRPNAMAIPSTANPNRRKPQLEPLHRNPRRRRRRRPRPHRDPPSPPRPPRTSPRPRPNNHQIRQGRPDRPSKRSDRQLLRPPPRRSRRLHPVRHPARLGRQPSPPDPDRLPPRRGTERHTCSC